MKLPHIGSASALRSVHLTSQGVTNLKSVSVPVQIAVDEVMQRSGNERGCLFWWPTTDGEGAAGGREGLRARQWVEGQCDYTFYPSLRS